MPAAFVIFISGKSTTGRLIIVSQVILSFALPFAVVPLVWFTASRKRLGKFVAPRITTALAWLIAIAIIALNGRLIYDAITG